MQYFASIAPSPPQGPSPALARVASAFAAGAMTLFLVACSSSGPAASDIGAVSNESNQADSTEVEVENALAPPNKGDVTPGASRSDESSTETGSESEADPAPIPELTPTLCPLGTEPTTGEALWVLADIATEAGETGLAIRLADAAHVIEQDATSAEGLTNVAALLAETATNPAITNCSTQIAMVITTITGIETMAEQPQERALISVESILTNNYQLSPHDAACVEAKISTTANEVPNEIELLSAISACVNT